jgi:hypothetical protein
VGRDQLGRGHRAGRAALVIAGPVGLAIGVVDLAMSIGSTYRAYVEARENELGIRAGVYGQGQALTDRPIDYGPAAWQAAATLVTGVMLAAGAVLVVNKSRQAATKVASKQAATEVASKAEAAAAASRPRLGGPGDPATPANARATRTRTTGERTTGEGVTGAERAVADPGTAPHVPAQPPAPPAEPPAPAKTDQAADATATVGGEPTPPEKLAGRPAPPPPPRRGTVGRIRDVSPGADPRTASGGIRRIERHIVNNRRLVVIEGRIDPVTLPKSLFRNEWPSAAKLSVPLPDYERIHLFPLQWGDEAAEGFMYAHGDLFNTSVQKRVENFARDLRDTAPSAAAEVHVKVTALSYPRDLQGSAWGDVLQEMSYELTEMSTGHTWTIEFNVGPPPHGQIEELDARFTIKQL